MDVFKRLPAKGSLLALTVWQLKVIAIDIAKLITCAQMAKCRVNLSCFKAPGALSI